MARRREPVREPAPAIDTKAHWRDHMPAGCPHDDCPLCVEYRKRWTARRT